MVSMTGMPRPASGAIGGPSVLKEVNALENERKLRLAARSNDIETLSSLLLGGTNVNASDGIGMTALMLAAACGYPKCCRLLCGCGASVEAKDKAVGNTALMLAARSGQTVVVELLLNFGAHVEATNVNGWTPFVHAVYGGHGSTNLEEPCCMKLLQKAGADIEVKTGLSETAMDWALRNHRAEARKLLESWLSATARVARKTRTDAAGG